MRKRYEANPGAYIRRQRDIRASSVKQCIDCGTDTNGKRCVPCSARNASLIATATRPPARPRPPRKRRDPAVVRAEAIERGRHQWTPLRQAYEAGDAVAFFNELRCNCTVNDVTGCWTWKRRTTREGYATVKWSDKSIALHRLSCAMAQTIDPTTPVVHHVCANRSCVNPDHLQPVSHRENIAEMMQRNYYLQRIQSLEDALREHCPDHALLAHVAAA